MKTEVKELSINKTLIKRYTFVTPFLQACFELTYMSCYSHTGLQPTQSGTRLLPTALNSPDHLNLVMR